MEADRRFEKWLESFGDECVNREIRRRVASRRSRRLTSPKLNEPRISNSKIIQAVRFIVSDAGEYSLMEIFKFENTLNQAFKLKRR